MTTTKATRRTRSTDRRRQLIDAATVLFAERGYPHVSVTDIARRAGVSAPTVYRHFADKQALLLAAVQTRVDELEESTAGADLASSDHPADALAASVTELSISNPHATSLWRWSGQHLSADENADVVRRTRAVLRQWASAIRADRPELTERESMYLAGAVLSVVGSGAGRAVRSGAHEMEEMVLALVRQTIRLTPSHAVPLRQTAGPGDDAPTRRDEILDAAARLFAENGFAGTGMDEIGAAVGITGPSVYKHFPSKLAILVGISQRSAMRLEAGVMAAYAITPDPAGRLNALVDHYVDAVTSSPDLLVGFVSSYVLAGEPQAAELLAVQRRYVARWVQLLTDIDADRPPGSAVLAVHAALAIVNDAVRLPRSTPRPEFAARMAYLMKGVMGV
ncbi:MULTISPECIES: TetR/AcrR family transcriptional regulator [Gordonia]|uniref:TetR/AcrR family transcriptional regulator n=1 Tax=Gordonia TaxID=2053 RepID=UPI0005F09119|nr:MULTISPECIES: TetR/AcrR family transcriptional regulator [Gordonia]KJR08326.1 TetR family transcriptional regulator [Gordonia sihwensis]KXT57284.1 TetR family transcriptional regulator [Gordonia sp. QH-12]MBY4568778.1 TetR family transcriptional regulator [Gordonia sihwensis]